MGNLHKKLTVDPATGNVGVNKDTPQTQLDVGGGIKIGTTNDTGAGIIGWNPDTQRPRFHNGTEWQDLGSGSGPDIDTPIGDQVVIEAVVAASVVEDPPPLIDLIPALPEQIVIESVVMAAMEPTQLTTSFLED